MLQTLKLALQQLLNDIDSGNSNITEDQEQEILKCIRKITDSMLTLTEAADYIGVCKATFNNYIDKGLIPKGTQKRGTSSLFWNKVDLDEYIKNKKK